jgi:hypothetical protein
VNRETDFFCCETWSIPPPPPFPTLVYNQICYIVSVKVQFFCLPIGQNRVTCRSTKRHVRQPVRNETFIDRSIIKWVQTHACQPWSSKVHFLNFLLNIYSVPFIQFWFQIKFTPITGELFILWHLYTVLYNKALIYWDLGKTVCFVALDRRCCPRLRLGQKRRSRIRKTHCFPRSQ